MPLRSTPITGASSLLRADAPWINRSFPTCADRSVILFTSWDVSVHGSFVPYILALHLVLARPSDPAAITGLCD